MASAPGRWGTVWITGASSGIGLELARLIAPRAERVAVSARSTDQLEALARDHRAISPCPLDVTDAQAVARCVGTIEAEGGGIDLAVLNAGAWTLMDVDRLDLAAVRRGVEVNVMGVMNALDALLPGMLARGAGHIVLVASVAGYRGLPRSVAYGPTKAALINLAETLKLELEPRGITVSLVNPGFVDTPMTRKNPFPMPGLMSAGDAAQAMLAGIERGTFEIRFPRGFTLVLKALQLLPYALYFPLVRRFVMKA